MLGDNQIIALINPNYIKDEYCQSQNFLIFDVFTNLKLFNIKLNSRLKDSDTC